MPTYFTFLDGALRYDCATCGQACCRGKGMALDPRELVPLLVREPRLAPVLTAAPSGLAGWADVTDGCWFLEDDGWCAVERRHGRDAKPTTCRLFPFNRVFRVGPTRVVDFNSVICPLDDAGGTGITWRELEEDLARVPDGPLTASQAPAPASGDARWENLERAILEATRTHLDKPPVELAAWQHAATIAWLDTGDGDRFPPSFAGLDDARERMSRLEKAWAEFYGLATEEDPAAPVRLGRALALLTPSLRFNTLFRRGGPPWAAAVLRLPRLLLATAFLARAATALRPRPGLRALTELHQNTVFVRELLSRWEEPAVLASSPAIDAPEPFGSALRLAAQALSPFRAPPRPLGVTLSEAWAPLPPPLRAATLTIFSRMSGELRFES